MIRYLLVAVFFVQLWNINSQLEVPTEKAKVPLMDPKPQMPTITDKVYLDVEINGVESKIVIGLFGELVPKTVENFKSLCACDKGLGELSDEPLCYKNTKFHRIIPNFMIQAGDFTHFNGQGGESIYGGKFEDESFEIKHNKRYLVSMANSGPHTNGSQFFINTVKTSWLDGKHVVFGTVLEGKSTVDLIETYGTNSGVPKTEVIIKDSGVVTEPFF
mmetsp:Transcript_26478/g.30772  ORF Transcript_26478/g.30772 Transcript_26478/m.30772 type:complete len:217 (-) Transcript_26478:1398-2048(-)